MKNIEENMSKKIFVLDTCSIGKFCNDQDFKIEELTNIQLAYLSIQVDEIENCPSDDRKKRLLKSLKLLESRSLSSVVMDISNWDDSYFEDETNVDYYEIIKEYQINKYSKKNIDNIARDALIASTCLDLNYNLITEDTGLREKFKELNPNLICLNWEDFKKTLVWIVSKNTDNVGIKKSKSTFNIYKYIKKKKKRSILNYLKLRFKIYKWWVRNQYKTLDEYNITNLKFRIFNDIFIPYIELFNIRKLIKEIKISPSQNQKLLENSISIFKNNYKLHNIEISKSDIPMRY